MNDYWLGRRVFVTGVTGLVGSWLVKKLLEEKAQVKGLIRDWDPQSELIRSGDVQHISVVSGCLEEYATLERAINEFEVDTVFHLGAQTIVGSALRSPLQTFESNIRGTYNLLEACRRHQDRISSVVVASSDKAYGASDQLPYKENYALLGRAPYDVSKSCTDLLTTSYWCTYELPVAIVRCGNIYGGGDLNWSRIVPGTIRSLLNGESPVIRSDGKFVRDYLYVKDAISAYLILGEQLPNREEIRGQAFNFSPEVQVSVLQIVKKIGEIMNVKNLDPVILNETRAEITEQYLSAQKARDLLNWIPNYTLECGLKETIAWYERFLSVK